MGHLNGYFAPRGENLNKPIFKSSNARGVARGGMLNFRIDRRITVRVSGERQKFLRLLQNENEPIASWETRVRNQAAQCEYENFAEEVTRDQFIAGLTSEALRVKLIGKGHSRHRDTAQTKVTLREVVEVANAFEATTFANK